VRRAYPEDSARAFVIATAPDLSDQVILRDRTVYVDPYTGTILGAQPNGPDWLAFVHQLHLRLSPNVRSSAGKSVVAWSAVVMLLLLLSGLYLWWPIKRIRFAWRGASRRAWFDRHNASGALSFLLVLFLVITGLALGFEQQSRRLFYALTSTSPANGPSGSMARTATTGMIGPDQAAAIARDAVPGATPFLITMPDPGGALEVRARFPEDLTPGGRSRVYLNPYTGKVLFAEGSRTAPAGTRLINWNRAIHTGDILGIPGKALVSLASLAAAFQVLSGVIMWWKRR